MNSQPCARSTSRSGSCGVQAARANKSRRFCRRRTKSSLVSGTISPRCRKRSAEQKAWIEAHKPKVCDRNGPPQLTEAQIAQIRALKQAFAEAVADELAAIKAAHQEARAAKQAGASAEELRAILEGVKDEMEAVRQAEIRLHDAIMDVLTPEQRANWCIVRARVAPGPGPGRP
jgi:hypothetical protein